MFSKTRLFAFVLVIAGLAVGNAQTSSAKLPSKTTTTAQVTKTSKTAKATTAPATTKSVAVLQLNADHMSANASVTSQVLHPVTGRSMLQAVPKSMSRTTENKFKKTPTVKTSTDMSGLGIEFARGLSNDLSLNVSTDIGTETRKATGAKEESDTGLSDIKVAITKMYQADAQQSFLSGYLTGGLPATRGNVTAQGKTLDGNRFSGGMTLGTAYTKQNAGVAGNFGYKLSAAIQFPIKADVKQEVPDYSAYEMTGGHTLGANMFAEKIISASAKIGGGAGVNIIMPSDMSVRTPEGRGSASIGQQNIMSLRAFAAFNAGQLEFMPTAVFERNLGAASDGNLSVESQESATFELVTRFSL